MSLVTRIGKIFDEFCGRGAERLEAILDGTIADGRGQMRMKKIPGPGPRSVPTLFIGKWTVKIISSLQERPRRHGQLRRHLGNISQRMLTRTLRNLESAGLIVRRVDKSGSIAVEYSLTELGRTFVVPLNSICGWAKDHHKELSATVRLLAAGGKHS